jgi:hypothetical protein
MENMRDIQNEATSKEALPVEDKYADPGEPPSPTESQAFREHCKKVLDYAVAERKSMDEDESLRGIRLWYDLGTSIRPSNFECLPADEICRWRNMIRNKGNNVPTGRDIKIKTVMIDLLTGSEYLGDIQPSNASKNEGMTPLANAPPEVTSAATSNRGGNHGDANTFKLLQ